MIDSKQNAGLQEPEPEDVRFLREALDHVSKAERFQRAKQIVATVGGLAAAFWWAYRKSGPELGVEGAMILIVGLIVAICTAKIMGLINKNTKTILQAIADLQRK